MTKRMKEICEKEKGANKKYEKKGKARRAYNDYSFSSSSSKDDEEANLF